MKKYFPFLIIFVISFLFLFPLFKPGMFLTHDGENHIARIGAYFNAFSDLQIPPRWAGNLNYRYGAPVFIFFYPLPGYIGSLIHALGFNLIDTFKVLLGLAFLAAPITFFVWIRRLVKVDVALVASLLYGLAPYHFLNLYVRGDIGELFAFVFFPLVLLAFEYKHKTSYFLLGVFSYFFLILSHNVLSLLFSLVYGGYILYNFENAKVLVKKITMLLFGLLFSAYFWLPALWESKFINHEVLTGNFYQSQFPTFLQLIYSPWGFGPNVSENGGLSPQLGIILFVLTVISIFVLLRFRIKLSFYWLGVFFSAIFLSLSASSFLWNHVPLLPQFQFPWRFMALSSTAAVILIAFFLNKYVNKKIVFCVGALFLFSVIPFTQTNGNNFKNDSYYTSFTGTTFYHGEATTVWTSGNMSQIPKQPIELIGGEGTIKNITRNSWQHTFLVEAKTQMQIRDNTEYFPGWKAVVDGNKVPIEFQDMNHRGIITFLVPKGNHTVIVEFGETPIRLIADIISLSSLFLLFFLKYLAKKI